jgi:hypothetical protein
MAMPLPGWLIPLLLLSAVFSATSLQPQTTFEIGAWGDDASRSNLGVKVQIETRSYNTSTFNYFWVGDYLSDGAFIQFGYSLEPGLRCLLGASLGGAFTCEGASESIANSDTRWQWQYWPDISKSDFYFGIGPFGSAGPNASYHEYDISLSASNTWSFIFDDTTVKQTTFPASPSADPVLIVAEGSAGNSSLPLGPVRFDDLSYFDGSEWKRVDSLIATSYCGVSVGCVANQYGAMAVGSDSLLVGSGIPRSPDSTLLWTSQQERVIVQVHPGVQFFITSTLGTQAYDGAAEVSLPKGMFAYISLPDTDVSTPGVLGWFGAQDQFQGWVGSVDSRNLTAQVLVDSNKSVTAVWTTDATLPIYISTIGIAFVVAAVFLALASRRSKGRRPETNRSACRPQTWRRLRLAQHLLCKGSMSKDGSRVTPPLFLV